MDDDIGVMDLIIDNEEFQTMEEDLRDILTTYTEEWHARGQAALAQVEQREKDTGKKRFDDDFDTSGIDMEVLQGGAPVFFKREPMGINAQLVYKGLAWFNATLRWKGRSSLIQSFSMQSWKRGFYLTFTEQQPFFGLQKIYFSNCYLDAVCIRDKMASQVYRQAGLSAARVGLMRVNVHMAGGAQYWGLFSASEDMGVLAYSFKEDKNPGKGDKGSKLIQPTNATWALPFNPENFGSKNKEDVLLVEKVFEALHSATREEDPKAWRKELEEVFDVETFISYLATSLAIGNWDSYGSLPHNYFLYELNGRLVWLPFDHNLAFQDPPQNVQLPSVMRDETHEKWALIRFLLDDPVYRRMYKGELEWLRSEEGPMHKKTAMERAKRWMAKTKPHITGGEDGKGNVVDGEMKPFTLLADIDKDFPKAERALLSFLKGNDDRIAWGLKKEARKRDRLAKKGKIDPDEDQGDNRKNARSGRRVFHDLFRTTSEGAVPLPEETQRKYFPALKNPAQDPAPTDGDEAAKSKKKPEAGKEKVAEESKKEEAAPKEEL